jgi:signal transduction histidine kinase
VFTAEISSAVLRDSAGKPKGMICILRNVTSRIATQEALRRAGEKLNLLGAITRHDILNKLTVLVGYIDLARHTDDPEIMRDFLRKIDEIAEVLTGQIEFTKDYQDLA